MKHFQNISAQKVSWLKSNKNVLESVIGIENLFYPETIAELTDLIRKFNRDKEKYDVIGHSSNTLFLPSYRVKNLICTKYLKNYTEDDDYIYCECGVCVSVLSKYAISQGYQGFEGLCDLPGTIASGVYGNCGCFGCTVLGLVESFTFMTENNEVKELSVPDLKATFRSTSLKRGDLKGVILQVKLKKIKGNPREIRQLAEIAHARRIATQPTGANNLGSTFNGGLQPTLKGYFFKLLLILCSKITPQKQQREYLPFIFRIYGQSRFSPYLWNWGRWMFYDENSYDLFPEYYKFLKTLFKDIRLEIEIKK